MVKSTRLVEANVHTNKERERKKDRKDTASLPRGRVHRDKIDCISLLCYVICLWTLPQVS